MIEDLERKVLADWSRGRYTSDNQATVPTDALLVARNVIRQNGAMKPVPGYSMVQTMPLDLVERMFSFERQTDQKQFLITTGGDSIARGSIDGSMAPVLMDNSQVDGDFDFLEGPYALYMNNKHQALKMINIGGVETLVPWGLNPAINPPSIAIGGVGLTLTYGTRYVYSEVMFWTDSLGTQRFHISVPSDFSAHTGPLANKSVTIGGMVPVNPLATHFWIFRVQDSVIGASGDYFFVAQVPVVPGGPASYVDNASDDDLDTTRIAPFDNYPPPLSNIAFEYGGRAVLLAGDTVYLSALDEIQLGVAYECFPSFLQFIIPGGIKNLTAGIVLSQNYQQVALLSTEDFWFQVGGPDISNFTMLDKVVKPGAAGRKLVLLVHGRLVWLGRDKKLWTWNLVAGVDPVPMSVSIHSKSSDQLSMEDLDPDFLAKCELQWYSNGTYDIIVLVASSTENQGGEKDWIQLWDLSPVTGVLTIQGPIPQPAESDFFPYDRFSTSLVAKSGGIPYIFFGALNSGQIFRWPDGHTFNGADIDDALIGSPWVELSQSRAKPKFAKILTNYPDPKTAFRLLAVASQGVDPKAAPVDIELEDDIVGNHQDGTVARGNLMQQPETAFGNWLKIFVAFPQGVDADISLAAIELFYEELPGV